MTPYSRELLQRLATTEVDVRQTSPRLLLAADQVQTIRQRARSTPGAVDALAAAARQAAADESLFGAQPEIPYLVRRALRPLGDAALILQDAASADRALQGVEVLFGFAPEEWIARPHRPTRCDHAMLNVAADIALTMDHCADLWPAGALDSVATRLHEWTLGRFLETWDKQDAHWSKPEYHWNWKIMCCGEAGLTALACRRHCPDLQQILQASLVGSLDILDCLPSEGDWPEGPSYWLGTLGFGLRFGLALRHATGGTVDLLAHPQLDTTGDFIVQVTEPDSQVYNFNDNPTDLGSNLDSLLLLATARGRGDWARIARGSQRFTLERLAWDDPELVSECPSTGNLSRLFPWTGLATLRSGWEPEATFIGFKCGASAVGHSHLDANSFVVSAGGERLLVDEGLWPYAHAEGFFDLETRFNFDGNATIGHNSLLVNGQGQVHGSDHAGRIVDYRVEDGVTRVTGDAAAAYGGRLQQFLRTVVLVDPQLIILHDRVSTPTPAVLEWLFHHGGQVQGDEQETIISRGNVSLSMRRLVPERAECWRVSDVTRSSSYTNSNTLQPERVSMQYRSMGPFHPQQRLEVVWALCINSGEAPPTYRCHADEATITVDLDTAHGQHTVELARTP